MAVPVAMAVVFLFAAQRYPLAWGIAIFFGVVLVGVGIWDAQVEGLGPFSGIEAVIGLAVVLLLASGRKALRSRLRLRDLSIGALRSSPHARMNCAIIVFATTFLVASRPLARKYVTGSWVPRGNR
jgi:hypothetical protein